MSKSNPLFNQNQQNMRKLFGILLGLFVVVGVVSTMIDVRPQRSYEPLALQAQELQAEYALLVETTPGYRNQQGDIYSNTTTSNSNYSQMPASQAQIILVQDVEPDPGGGGGLDLAGWVFLVIAVLEAVARLWPDPKVTGIIGYVISFLNWLSNLLNREKPYV